MSVVGNDGLFLAGIANPPLTTVQLPGREMAQAMVERAINSEVGEQVFASAGLLQGGSVAHCKVRA